MEPDFKILAIHALAPNADWTYGGTYAELNWINGNGNDNGGGRGNGRGDGNGNGKSDGKG